MFIIEMWGFGLHLGNKLKTGVRGTHSNEHHGNLERLSGPTQFVKIGQVVEAGQH